MKGLEPSLLEKLFDDSPRSSAVASVVRPVSLEQYKESVARDLEGLLNSRCAFDEDALVAFPECQRSLMTYGLCDFAAKSLANAYDRAAICRSLEQAIARHQRRLHHVQVQLDSGNRAKIVRKCGKNANGTKDRYFSHRLFPSNPSALSTI